MKSDQVVLKINIKLIIMMEIVERLLYIILNKFTLTGLRQLEINKSKYLNFFIHKVFT